MHKIKYAVNECFEVKVTLLINFNLLKLISIKTKEILEIIISNEKWLFIVEPYECFDFVLFLS